MGRKSAKDCMGLPYHASILHHGDTFQPSVRVGRHDPSRDTRKLAPFPRFHGGRVQRRKEGEPGPEKRQKLRLRL